jgi:hypothetical protein
MEVTQYNKKNKSFIIFLQKKIFMRSREKKFRNKKIICKKKKFKIQNNKIFNLSENKKKILL